MARRRRRAPAEAREGQAKEGQKEGARRGGPPGPQPAQSQTQNQGQNQGRKAVSLPALLKVAFERAAEAAKRELGDKGRIAPMAVFGYRADPAAGPDGGGEIFKAVSLVWRTELQKEAVRRRVREKAAAEHAAALVVLARSDREGGGRHRGSPEQKGVLAFSGAMNGVRASARVSYVLQRETKSFTTWDMHLSGDPLESFFLDGIFAPPRAAR